jgi:CHRD domain
MRNRFLKTGLIAIATLLGASSLMAGDDGDKDRGRGHDRTKFVVSAKLASYNEVPSTLSTTGHGTFWALVDTEANTITFKLTYDELESPVTQAHVHFGSRFTAGGISFFLCTNGTPPAGQTPQACPVAGPAEVTGTITPENIIGPAGQGIPVAAFDEIEAAMKAGVAYANVHTSTFPAGEIRGQLH